jgi:phage-related protein
MPEPVAEAVRVEEPGRRGPPAARERAGAPRLRALAALPGRAPLVRLRPRSAGTPPPSAPAPLAQAIRAPGPGQPLPPPVHAALTASLGVDVSPVRVHTDPGAAAAAAAVPARAFAYGPDVFLAQGERATDVTLMAHEVAHVVQQQGQPTVQAYSAAGGSFEGEANRTAAAVAQGEPAAVGGRTGGPQVQGQFGEWVEDKIWGLLERYAPVLVPIIRQGFFNWLTEKITSAVESMLDTLMKPVRAVTGIFDSLSSHFTNLVQWVREAAQKIARGDCSSITEAAEKIQDVITGLAAPVIDRVKEWAEKVKGFFVDMWEKVGAPIWEFLKGVGGAIWDTIKDIANWIWEKTKPVRDWIGRAWKWIKDKLGIGEGPEGQNGILQWVQDKAGEAWKWVKAKIEPYKKQILIVAGVIIALTAGPIIAVAAAAGGIVFGIRWISQHLRTRGSVVDQRGALERDVIPRFMGAINGLTDKLSEIAASLTEKFGAIVGGLGKLVGQLAGSILAFLVGLVNWVVEKFKALLQWATEKVKGIADWIKQALERLKAFLQPLLDFVRWIGSVIADIWNLVSGFVKRIWAKIPACIKDPVVDFLINQILKRIPIFSKLTQVKDIWDKLKNGAMTVIRAIFVKWDLKAAVYAVFDLVLTILDIPKQLVLSIYAKARNAWDEIVKDPLGFLKNTLAALWQGFKQFFGNIFTHLWNGVISWFKGVLGAAKIEFPSEFTLGSVIKFVLGVLGITIEKIFSIIEKKTRPGIAAILNKVWRTLTGVWDFVVVVMEKGPTAIWQKLKDYATGMLDALIGALVDWATMKIITVASPRLLAALNPIGAIINAILAAWAAIQTAGQYIRNILEIVDTVLDTALEIAAGVIGKAAGYVEKALAFAIPIAIGFLVNFLRLGDLPERIHEMVEKLQAKVEEGLGKLIDKALAAGRAILDRLGVATGAKDDVTFVEEGGGATHHLLVEGEENAERLFVQSQKRTAQEQLDFWAGKVAAREVPAAEDPEAVKKKIDAARKLLTPAQLKASPTGTTGRTEYMKKVADAFKGIYPIFGHHTVPPTVLTYKPLKSTSAGVTAALGAVAIAEPLSKTPAQGFSPAASTSDPIPSEQTGVFNELTKKTSNWVKMHLIHFDLHGPDKALNFAPGTKAANTSGMAPVEHTVIAALRAKDDVALWYEVVVKYWGEATRADFAETVDMKWGEWKPKGGGGTRATTNTLPTIRISPPIVERGRGYLSSDGAKVLSETSGLPMNVAQAVVDGRNALRALDKLPTGQFDSVKQVLEGIQEARPRFDLTLAKDAISEAMGKGKLRLNP